MSDSVPTRRARQSSAGLTLLEVLAAAMIFAIVMTVLIGTSTEAVQRAGVTKRRLEASMWADELIAQLEVQMQVPERPSFEDEVVEDPFTARVTESKPIQGSVKPAAASALPSMGAAQIGMFFPPLAEHTWRYDVEIEWNEAGSTQKIERTTYFFDWAAATEQYPNFFPSDAGAAGDAGEGDGQGGNVPQLPDAGGRADE